MTSLANAPASVQRWFAAETSADPEADLRAALAADVVFDFGGRRVQGIDAVIGTIGFMIPPGWLGAVEWSLRPPAADGRITVRGVAPGGANLSSPGGPMSAIDYTFGLNAEGLINLVAPQPYHLEPQSLVQPLHPGEVAPDFVLPDVNGANVALHDPNVNATVVVFTCNHCPFSLAWHDRVQQVGRDYAARGVRLLQINPNDAAINRKDGVEYSRQRVAEGHFVGPYLVDAGQHVARRWGARHTPEIFVLDARGVVAYHGAPDADTGDESLNAGWLRAALDSVLAGAVPNPAETQPVGCSIKWTL